MSILRSALVAAASLCAMVGTSARTVAARPAPTPVASAWAVYDETSHRWLLRHRADTELPVGSLMKLLTAYVVQRAGSPDHVVTIPPMVVDPYESQIGVRRGEQYSRAALVRAMLIVSASDAARALAVDVGGSEVAFVRQMNRSASQLGLLHTMARNSMGLDATGAHSTANDMIRLAVVLRADAAFRATVARTSAVLHGRRFPTTNHLLLTFAGANGVKTGHTGRAGYCVVASATRNGRTILVAVLGAPTDATRVNGAAALLRWGFDQP